MIKEGTCKSSLFLLYEKDVEKLLIYYMIGSYIFCVHFIVERINVF
mgnify:CR=1 FL=1